MFDFVAIRPPRRPGLTPLIDVVFLLLVFFMLAAQFGRDLALPLGAQGGGVSDYTGPPRLITILPDAVLLNGVPMPEADLPAALGDLTQDASDTIILQARDGADVQRLTDVVMRLSRAGYSGLILAQSTP